MSKYLAIVLVGFLAIALVSAKPKPKQNQEPSQIQQLATRAEQALSNATAVIEGNLPDSQHIIDTVSSGAQTLVNHFQTLSDSIKTELKNNQGGIDSVLQNVTDRLHEAKASIEKALGPDGQKKAKQIKDSLDKSVKEAVEQLDKLGKAVEPEATKVKTDIENASKAFLDNVIEVSKDLQAKLTAKN
ncbi:hypothetical protein JTB14_003003 [Gonioctena quinquepunctata]|nr:hypothetical protein JTB14_003003 [Gonioctena quinquepunctata]